MNDKNNPDDWINRGKSIRQLIKELETFEDDSLEVKISIDYGETFKPISIVVKNGGGTDQVHCGLMYAAKQAE